MYNSQHLKLLNLILSVQMVNAMSCPLHNGPYPPDTAIYACYMKHTRPKDALNDILVSRISHRMKPGFAVTGGKLGGDEQCHANLAHMYTCGSLLSGLVAARTDCICSGGSHSARQLCLTTSVSTISGINCTATSSMFTGHSQPAEKSFPLMRAGCTAICHDKYSRLDVHRCTSWKASHCGSCAAALLISCLVQDPYDKHLCAVKIPQQARHEQRLNHHTVVRCAYQNGRES